MEDRQCSAGVRTRNRPGGTPWGTLRDRGKLKEGDPGSPKCMLGERSLLQVGVMNLWFKFLPLSVSPNIQYWRQLLLALKSPMGRRWQLTSWTKMRCPWCSRQGAQGWEGSQARRTRICGPATSVGGAAWAVAGGCWFKQWRRWWRKKAAMRVGATELSHPSRLFTCGHLQPVNHLPLSTPWLPSPSVRVTRVAASEVWGKSDNGHEAPRTGLQWMVAVGLCHLVVPICASPGTVVRPKLLLPEKLHPSVTCGAIYQILTQRQLGPNTMLREDKTQSSQTEPVSTLVTQLLGGLRVSGDNMSQGEVTGGDFQTAKWHLDFHSNEGWWHLKRERLTPSPPVCKATATSRAWTLATHTEGTQESWGSCVQGTEVSLGLRTETGLCFPLARGKYRSLVPLQTLGFSLNPSAKWQWFPSDSWK